MAKYTTTIMEIIQSELINNGFNEFVNNGKLTFDNQDFAFIQKVLRFDEDVKKIVDKTIFKGFNFADEKIDNHFKKSFVTRFLDREIGRQTVEGFASLVLYETLIREDYISTVFGSEVYKYLENHVDYNADQIGNTIEDEVQNQINEEIQNQKNKETQNVTQNQNSEENQNETQNQNSEENQNETQNQNNSSNTDTNSQNVSSDRELTSSLPQSEINLDVDNDILLYGDSNTISKNKTTNDSNEKTTGESDSTSDTITTGTQDTTGETITTGTQDSTGETITTGNQDTTTNGTQDNTRNSNQDTSSNQTSLSKTYLLENLEKIYSMRERLFNDYDKKCFLHIW